MPYVTAPTFVGGGTVTASNLNILSGNSEYLKAQIDGLVYSAFQVRRASTQSLADGVPENVSFTAETIDNGGWFPGTGETVTVPAGVIPAGATTVGMFLTASATFATNATGSRVLRILHNGSDVDARRFYALSGDPTVCVIEGTLIEVEAGDELELEAEQDSGGALNITIARFQGFRVGVAS